MKLNTHTTDRITPAHVMSTPMALSPANLLLRHLTNPTDQSTAMNIVGTAEGGVQFRYTVPTGKVFLLHTIAFHLVDANIEPEQFGGLGSALDNGCQMHIHYSDDSHLVELVKDKPITSNIELAHLGAASLTHDPALFGTNQDVLFATMNFLNLFGGAPLMSAGQYLAFHIRDDLSGLTHFEGVVSGLLYDAS